MIKDWKFLTQLTVKKFLVKVNQCTVQLTIFEDGILRISPLLLFRGQGLPIKKVKRSNCITRVINKFQKNAWCSEGVMVTWTQIHWGSYCSNLSTPGFNGKLLISDIH